MSSFCLPFLIFLILLILWFQAYADSGTVKQNYVNILLLLLRLRQACDHPLLVRGYDSDSVFKSSIHVAKKLPREQQSCLLNCLEASLAICHLCSVCCILIERSFVNSLSS